METRPSLHACAVSRPATLTQQSLSCSWSVSSALQAISEDHTWGRCCKRLQIWSLPPRRPVSIASAIQRTTSFLVPLYDDLSRAFQSCKSLFCWDTTFKILALFAIQWLLSFGFQNCARRFFFLILPFLCVYHSSIRKGFQYQGVRQELPDSTWNASTL